MLRYLNWVLSSIRKDLALRNYVAIWQKTLARLGLIGELLAKVLRLSPKKLVAVQLGVSLCEANYTSAAAACVRRGIALSGDYEFSGVTLVHRARFAALLSTTRTTELRVEGTRVSYLVTNRVGRLRLAKHTAISEFHNPPAAAPLVIRELARHNLLDFHAYLDAWLTSLPEQKLNPEAPVLLYLPEVGLRNAALASEDLIAFAGITADEGWLGCAHSYRGLARLALDGGLAELTVLEDDALLAADWRERWAVGRGLIEGRIGAVSGMVSDVPRLPKLWRVERIGNQEFFVSGHFSSTVFSIFSRNVLEWLSRFPLRATDPNSDGIDRYLATMPDLEVALFRPALVEHNPAARSTLWRFNNRTYLAQIAAAERLIADALRPVEGDQGGTLKGAS